MTKPAGTNTRLNIALWVAQVILAGLFGMFGSMKAFQPLDQIAGMMKWVPTMSPIFVRALGTAEILGAIGLILPSATGIVPRLTVAAAVCFLVLQAFAVALHLSRGEANVLGLNAALIALLLFVLWGEHGKSSSRRVDQGHSTSPRQTRAPRSSMKSIPRSG